MLLCIRVKIFTCYLLFDVFQQSSSTRFRVKTTRTPKIKTTSAQRSFIYLSPMECTGIRRKKVKSWFKNVSRASSSRINMSLLFVHLAILSYATTLALPTKPEADDIKPNYKLPEIFETSNYVLNLTVPAEVFSNTTVEYTGTVKIEFSFTNDTDFIALHANPVDIKILGINFNNIDVYKEDYSVDNNTEILKIKVVNSISVNRTYALVINFIGRISVDDMNGFYMSSYTVNGNVTKYLVTTQFEPTHARKAFPCFDEPSFKAMFDVSITYPSNLKVLFNTPQESSTTNDTTRMTTAYFKRTPPMSTYLLAFIISEFSCSPGKSINGVRFQVCSRNETAGTRDLAVDIGSKVIDKLNSFTNFNFNASIMKMDQVAIPDFAAGAMENWGLVTYRESALLWDKEESSDEYKQRVTTVIAHEFSHQWFGDLVTCHWWSEIFLNEGFATYFEYHIANEVVTSDWELDKQFLVEQVQTSLASDAMENSQALQEEAYSPVEIDSRFGTTSYNKGGSVLRMVAHFLGLENFRAGLQEYLSKKAYSAAIPEDLWSALDGISNVSLPADTLGDVMENWVKKPGFPLVSVKLNGNNVTVTQGRFLFSSSDNSSKWYVPITYTSSQDKASDVSTSPSYWLTPTKDVTFSLPKNATWIILNNKQTGYYRVNYDDALWNNIKAALDSKDFSGIGDLNRAQIINDLFSLARANKVKYSLVLNIANYLIEDTSYYPWYAAFDGFDFLLRRVGQNQLGSAISGSLLELMKKLYESVPWSKIDRKNQIYTLKQVLALKWACKLGNEDCIKQVKTQFEDYKNTKKRPNPNLRPIIYCNALKHSSNKSDWEYLWNEYLKASDLASEQATILTALGCTSDSDTLKEYLNKTVTDNSGIRMQDALSAYASVYSGSAEGLDVAFDFLIENYELIADKYQSMNALGSLIKGIAGRFTTQEQVNKLKDFIKNENLPEAFSTAANEAMETAKTNLDWLSSFEEQLNDFYGISGVGRIGASMTVTLLAVLVCKLFL